jgi:hypothetical protein
MSRLRGNDIRYFIGLRQMRNTTVDASYKGRQKPIHLPPDSVRGTAENNWDGVLKYEFDDTGLSVGWTL